MIKLNDVMVFLGPALGAGIGWLAARKKNDAQARKTDVETDSLELKNMHEIIEIWKNTVKDLRIEVKHLQVQVAYFRKENTELKEVISNLHTQMEDMKKLLVGKPDTNS